MFLAFVRSVAEAPGKFTVVNMPFAGSLVSTPKFTVGTRVCWLYVNVTHENFPPKLRLWEPRAQLNVSLMSRYSGFRRLGALVAVAPLIPATAIPVAAVPGLRRG